MAMKTNLMHLKIYYKYESTHTVLLSFLLSSFRYAVPTIKSNFLFHFCTVIFNSFENGAVPHSCIEISSHFTVKL